MANAPKYGDLPYELGATVLDVDGDAAPITAPVDRVTANDLVKADMQKIVPGVTASDVVAPSGKSIIGNQVVSFATVDGTAGGALANVKGMVQNFPVATVAEYTAFKTAFLAGTTLPVVNRILRPALNTAYAFYFDVLASPFDYGKVPGDNMAAKKTWQQPIIGDGPVALNDAWYEQNTGLYWVCTTAGDPMINNTIGDVVQFKAFAPVVHENLNEWNQRWAENPAYTVDYDAVNAAVLAALTKPTDWSNYADAAYTLAIKANAGRRAFGPGTVLKSDLSPASPVSGTDDAVWEAKFAAMYVVSNVVHPSAVSHLRAALYEQGDARPETYNTGVTYITGDKITVPIKGATWDLKVGWPYDGGNNTLGDSTLGINPQPSAGPLTVKSQAMPGDLFPAEPTVTASDSTNAAKLAGLGYVASPTTNWTTGQKITIGTFAFNWTGSAWAAGTHA